MKVADLVGAMEVIAPTRHAAEWDNVGLLVGDARAPLARVVLAVDATASVLAEAASAGAALVAYHPPLFSAQKRFFAGSIAFEAARAGVAVYSPHTALDVAPGGTNDVLADVLGLAERAPLRAVRGAPGLKLVTFVPAGHVDSLSAALFAAGAGRIGRYASCSFRTPGTGTFFGEAGARPALGEAGRLEVVDELRLECVVAPERVEVVLRALRGAHPYEEPAFDIQMLAPPPTGLGLGRVGSLTRTTARALAEQVKARLGVEHLLVAGPLDRDVTRAAVCAGAGGDLVGDAVAAKADLLLTGELRHHDALAAVAAGLTVIATRHSVGERAALPALKRALEEQLPGLGVSLATSDRDPFDFG